MNTLMNKNQEILNGIKHCISSFGLPVVEEINVSDQFAIVSQFKYEHYGFAILAQYHPDGGLVEIAICYAIAPENKIKPLAELMNYINSHIMSGHFFVDLSSGGMTFRSAIHVTDSLNKDEFEWALSQVMSASYRFFPMIIAQVCTDEEPSDIFNKYLKEEPQEVDS